MLDKVVLQIHEYDPERKLVTDIWEADDRKTLLKCLNWRLVGGKIEGCTYTVHEMDGEKRSWDLLVAIPKGCKKPRPCIDGIDFLKWSPDGKHADGSMGKEAVIEAIVEAVQASNLDDMSVTAEGEVIVYTGIIRRADGTYHEKL